jgi:hypothetical protein
MNMEMSIPILSTKILSMMITIIFIQIRAVIQIEFYNVEIFEYFYSLSVNTIFFLIIF